MNIAMIWHIVKKDVRHTWMWIAAFLASLAGFGYTYSMMLLSCCDERIRLWTNAFEAMTVALVVAVTLFLAKLFHAEALPGTRQYWLARPVNWPDLLAAKTALAFAVILPSLTFMMIGIVSSQGFDIRWHISQLLLRIVIVAGSLLPVFALLAVTKNLQQVSIWLVGSFIALVMVNNMAHGMSSSWVNTSTATLDQATIEGDPIHVPSVCLVELTYLVEKGRLPHASGLYLRWTIRRHLSDWLRWIAQLPKPWNLSAEMKYLISLIASFRQLRLLCACLW